MMPWDFKSPNFRLSFLVVFAVLVQLLGKYYSKYFLTFKHFDTLKFLIIFLLPIFIGLFVLKFKKEELGLGKPKVPSAKFLGILILALVALPLIISIVLLSGDYLRYYSQYTNEGVDLGAKLQRFGIFTSSTLIGWEFIHRGFLLFGMRTCLLEMKVKENIAHLIPILWVMSLETTYHFIKPDLEAWGMLIFSPLLSWIAYRTRSFWIPFLIHLYLETVFILTIST